MKKEITKYYFMSCKIKWVDFVREGVGSDAIYHRHYKEINDALVIVTEGKKTIKYFQAFGVQFIEKEKRSKTLKFKGTEITKEKFDGILRNWKFEVAEAKEVLKNEQTKLEL